MRRVQAMIILFIPLVFNACYTQAIAIKEEPYPFILPIEIKKKPIKVSDGNITLPLEEYKEYIQLLRRSNFLMREQIIA